MKREPSDGPGGTFRQALVGSLITAGAVLATLLMAELGLRTFAPVSDPYAREKVRSINRFIRTDHAPRDSVKLDIDEGLPGVRLEGAFTTNNKGYRGPPIDVPKPANEWRVYMVGGSTVETFIIDDRESLDAVSQRELQHRVTGDRRVRVFNAGVSGHRSDDHVSLIVHRILHQEPDVVTVLAGVNDLIAAIYEMDYEHYGADFRSEEPDFDFNALTKMLATEFQLPRRVVYGVRRLRTGGSGLIADGVARSNYRPAIARLQSSPTAPRPPRTDVESYVRNLRTIVGAAAAHGVQLIFMTQPSTWNSRSDPDANNWHWLRRAAGFTYPEASADAALEQYNDAMRRVAAETGVPLFDLAASIPKSLDYFFDDVHLNVQGAKRVATDLASFMDGRGLLSR